MNNKLGVVVPYRDRPRQLSTFKKSISEYLDIPFELIVVEQRGNKDFNRGTLLNLGFLEAEKLGCTYVAFHDIDMLPIEVDYSYSPYPVHLITELELPDSVSRDLFDGYFGGVTIFPCNVFKQINGYSNKYYGWGFEDDDLFLRCLENNIKVNTVKIPQFSRNSVGLSFDGESSFVAIPNIIKSSRDFTIFTSFRYDSINRNPHNITDNNSIFSIPGFDTTLTIDSFFDIIFQFWKKNLDSVSINHKITPRGHFNVAVAVKVKAKTPEISLYINGEYIDRVFFDKLMPLHKQQYLYLGVGDPDREEKNNWFKGTIDRFAIFNKSLRYTDLKDLTKSDTLNLFNTNMSEHLSSYYEMLNVNGNILYDLKGKNDGYINNCKQVYLPKTNELIKCYPLRRDGTFKVLEHKENGYKDGYWVNWASRVNQLKYLDKFYENRSGFSKDGLSKLKRSKVDSHSIDNYHHLKVIL